MRGSSTAARHRKTTAPSLAYGDIVGSVSSRTGHEQAALAELVGRAAELGDASAARALVEQLWPVWLRLVRAAPAMRLLGVSEDHTRNVAVRLAEKFGQPHARTLKAYALWQERNEGKSFDDYHRIVVANAVRDYVRLHVTSEATDDGSYTGRRKRLLNEFAATEAIERVGFRPALTPAQTALQLVAFAERRLPPTQLASLRLWLEGAEPSELDVPLGVAAGEGNRALRAALATLRREFAR